MMLGAVTMFLQLFVHFLPMLPGHFLDHETTDLVLLATRDAAGTSKMLDIRQTVIHDFQSSSIICTM